ncbi:MAG: hypothetical protein JW741_09350 [Sedimentisphaerales bacterium]|nr:hypothetical protein [Sedimentisphaerales bacterium]
MLEDKGIRKKTRSVVLYAFVLLAFGGSACFSFTPVGTTWPETSLTIASNYAEAILVYSGGTLNIWGGTITSDYPAHYASVEVVGGAVNIYGGSLADGMKFASGMVDIYGKTFTVASVIYGSPGDYSVYINGTLTGEYNDGAPVNLSIVSLPGNQVTLHVTGGAPEPDIDIKPGSEDNCINIDGNGVIPVAILGSADFDVSTIITVSDDPALLPQLNESALRVRGKNLGCHIEDVSGPEGVLDGIADLMCQFVDDPDNWTEGQAEAKVTWYVAGDPAVGFEATDSVRIVKYTNPEP